VSILVQEDEEAPTELHASKIAIHSHWTTLGQSIKIFLSELRLMCMSTVSIINFLLFSIDKARIL